MTSRLACCRNSLSCHGHSPDGRLRLRICVLPVTVSAEIVATCAVLDAVADLLDRPIDLSHAVIGFDALAEEGSTIPDAVIKSARAADGVILGPVSHNDYPPVADGGLNPSGVLRKELSLCECQAGAKLCRFAASYWPGD